MWRKHFWHKVSPGLALGHGDGDGTAFQRSRLKLVVPEVCWQRKTQGPVRARFLVAPFGDGVGKTLGCSDALFVLIGLRSSGGSVASPLLCFCLTTSILSRLSRYSPIAWAFHTGLNEYEGGNLHAMSCPLVLI